MKLAICSLFRDSQVWHGRNINQVGRYFDQMTRQTLQPHETRFFLLEGNSQDNTRRALGEFCDRGWPIELFEHNVEGSAVVSAVDEQRFRNLSTIGNILIRAAREWADLVLWVESDLIIPNNLIEVLVEASPRHQFNEFALSPVPTSFGGAQFYDTWGFEGVDGRKWNNHELTALRSGPRYREMNSVGTCVMFNGEILRACSFDMGEDGCLPGLCRSGRKKGLHVHCDTSITVEHPSNELVAGRLI